MPNLSIRLGIDASRFDLDAPLPEIPPSNQSQSGRDTLVALARRENLTVRQLAQLMGGFGGNCAPPVIPGTVNGGISLNHVDRWGDGK